MKTLIRSALLLCCCAASTICSSVVVLAFSDHTEASTVDTSIITPPPVRHKVGVCFNNDYSSVTSSVHQVALFKATLINSLQHQYAAIVWLSADISQGSVRVVFETRAASEQDYETAMRQLYEDSQSAALVVEFQGRQYTVMADSLTVDGTTVVYPDEASVPVWLAFAIMLPTVTLAVALAMCLCWLQNRQRGIRELLAVGMWSMPASERAMSAADNDTIVTRPHVTRPFSIAVNTTDPSVCQPAGSVDNASGIT